MTATVTTPGDLLPFAKPTDIVALQGRVGKLEAALAALQPPKVSAMPACGVSGYVIDKDWSFGAGKAIPDIATLKTLFDPGLPWGVINNEWQRYTAFAPANCIITADELQLIATPTRGDGDGMIDSAEIVSKLPWDRLSGKGIVEFCCKMPAGLGMWPAGWLYPVPSTNANEIDVFEVVFNKADGTRDTTKAYFCNDNPAGQPLAEPVNNCDQWGGTYGGFGIGGLGFVIVLILIVMLLTGRLG